MRATIQVAISSGRPRRPSGLRSVAPAWYLFGDLDGQAHKLLEGGLAGRVVRDSRPGQVPEVGQSPLSGGSA